MYVLFYHFIQIETFKYYLNAIIHPCFAQKLYTLWDSTDTSVKTKCFSCCADWAQTFKHSPIAVKAKCRLPRNSTAVCVDASWAPTSSRTRPKVPAVRSRRYRLSSCACLCVRVCVNCVYGLVGCGHLDLVHLHFAVSTRNSFISDPTCLPTSSEVGRQSFQLR